MRLLVLSLFFFGAHVHALELEVKNVQPKSWFRKSPTSFEVKEYDAKNPPAVVASEPLVSCALDGMVCDPEKAIEFTFDRPVPSTRSLVLKTGDGKRHEFKFEFFQASDKSFAVKGKSAVERDFVFDAESYLLVLGPTGALKYYFAPDTKVHDFKPHDLDGKKYYSYLAVEKSAELANGIGRRILLDENFKPLETFKETMDGHDFLLLGRKHYLYTDYYTADAKDGSCVLENDVKESRDGRVTTVFSLSDFAKRNLLPLWTMAKFDGRECRNMGHLNSIQLIDADHLLIGIGNRAVLFDRRKRTADWIFASNPPSDFDVPKRLDFGLMHTPTWLPGAKLLVMYANSRTKNEPSRLLFFDLDIAEKKVTKPRGLPLEAFDSEYGGGSVVIGDGVVTVGHGHHEGPWDIQELKDGKVTMSLKLGPNWKYFNYRVYRAK